MIDSFLNLTQLIANGNATFENKKLTNVIKSYSFLYIFKPLTKTGDKDIFNIFKSSGTIIINQFTQQNSENETFFIIGFKRTIIIIKLIALDYLIDIFSSHTNLNICFLANSKEIFDEIIGVKYNEISMDPIFKEEIWNFNQNFQIDGINKFSLIRTWKLIQTCISGYLIQEGYNKKKIDRINNFFENEKNLISSQEIIEQEDCIQIRTIGSGSMFTTKLIYHIEKEELLAFKTSNSNFFDAKITKLMKREYDNYVQNKHPLIPKFYGLTNDKTCLVIEYINGKTLIDAEIKGLNYFNIIFQIMIIINYFHSNQFILRDLKPDNIMIDENQTVVLIDFDRMISANTVEKEEIHTNDFSSIFIAPEVNTNDFSYECDIYSLGKIIEYIMKKKAIENHYFEYICQQCTLIDPKERPSITKLICSYFIYVCSYITMDNLQQIFSLNKTNTTNFDDIIDKNDSEIQFRLGYIYYEGKHVPRDMDKSIKYYSLAAKQNNLKAQYNLGLLYYTGKEIKADIEKAIYYNTLAANQNEKNAQFDLGEIYFINGQYDKSIYYFSLAAKQNKIKAFFYLGLIHRHKEYYGFNPIKSVNYFIQGSDHNDVNSQYMLGDIFLIGKYVTRDITKGIHYYTLAANNDHLYSQFQLAKIYLENEYVKYDGEKAKYYIKLFLKHNDIDLIKFLENDILKKSILFACLGISQSYNKLASMYFDGSFGVAKNTLKAIHFLQLSAIQNDIDSQIALGDIYLRGEYNSSDIDKSIYYYTLAAKQNSARAQFSLGLIYMNESLQRCNIKKGLYYLSLAAEQNHSDAQITIGTYNIIHKNKKSDYEKGKYFIVRSAAQNNKFAQFTLGMLYSKEDDIIYDKEESIHFMTLSANQNFNIAQYHLGVYYLRNGYPSKGFNYLIQAINNGFNEANFEIGYLYHYGECVKRDIKKAIYHYHKVYSLNYAKNNLGIIYKNGFEGIQINKKYAIKLFEEAIEQSNDPVSMFNLAHIYLYDYKLFDGKFFPIDLLIRSLLDNIAESLYALCLFLILHYGNNLDKFKIALGKYSDEYNLFDIIIETIMHINLFDKSNFLEHYNSMKKVELIYDYNGNVVMKLLSKTPNKEKIDRLDVLEGFYEGFGLNFK